MTNGMTKVGMRLGLNRTPKKTSVITGFRAVEWTLAPKFVSLQKVLQSLKEGKASDGHTTEITTADDLVRLQPVWDAFQPQNGLTLVLSGSALNW